jgi:hypothetical protein
MFLPHSTAAFLVRFFMCVASQVLISSVGVLSSGSPMLCYMLYAQLYILFWHLSHRHTCSDHSNNIQYSIISLASALPLRRIATVITMAFYQPRSE